MYREIITLSRPRRGEYIYPKPYSAFDVLNENIILSLTNSVFLSSNGTQVAVESNLREEDGVVFSKIIQFELFNFKPAITVTSVEGYIKPAMQVTELESKAERR